MVQAEGLLRDLICRFRRCDSLLRIPQIVDSSRYVELNLPGRVIQGDFGFFQTRSSGFHASVSRASVKDIPRPGESEKPALQGIIQLSTSRIVRLPEPDTS